MDDDDSLEDVNDDDDNDERRQNKSFKSFHLLNALSDLMMLPKDLLLSKSIRKEVQHNSQTFLLDSLSIVQFLFMALGFCFEGMPCIFCTTDQKDSRHFCSRRILH